MAIDLFANFERTSNSSIFYRTVNFGSYPILLRLMDLDSPETTYSSTLCAEYSLNGGAYNLMPTSGGKFQDYLLFNCQVPALCSISARLKRIADNSIVTTFDIGCKFINKFPIANFAAYPKYVPYFNSFISSTYL